MVITDGEVKFKIISEELKVAHRIGRHQGNEAFDKKFRAAEKNWAKHYAERKNLPVTSDVAPFIGVTSMVMAVAATNRNPDPRARSEAQEEHVTVPLSLAELETLCLHLQFFLVDALCDGPIEEQVLITQAESIAMAALDTEKYELTESDERQLYEYEVSERQNTIATCAAMILTIDDYLEAHEA